MPVTASPNLVIRHRKENLDKCSLRGLESRDDLLFFRYPDRHMPSVIAMNHCVLLDMNGPIISDADAGNPILMIDGTWRLADKIMNAVKASKAQVIRRSLPGHFKTAYPRRQPDCQEPERGLASVEALYLAYHLTARDTTGLLDHYRWADDFLRINEAHL